METENMVENSQIDSLLIRFTGEGEATSEREQCRDHAFMTILQNTFKSHHISCMATKLQKRLGLILTVPIVMTNIIMNVSTLPLPETREQMLQQGLSLEHYKSMKSLCSMLLLMPMLLISRALTK